MTKQQRRFTHQIQFFTTPEQSEALEMLATQQFASVSALLRQMVALYVQNSGIATSRPAAANGHGQYHQEQANGIRP